MVGLFYTDEGARNIFSTKRIRNLKDIKGMKMRVPESVLMMDTFSALQARPIPLPYGDVFEAIKNGVVEGGENPVTAYLSNELYEIAPYYLMSEHVFSPGIVLMAEEKWNELSDEDKNILIEAGRRASAWNRSAIQEEEARIYEELEQKGVTITKLSPEDMEKARNLEEIVRISFTPGLEDYLARIIDIQK
jgi:TRAP-type C4-dicarboxylate transport system substrate-binding protein